MEEIEKLVENYNEKTHEQSSYPLITIIKEYPEHQVYSFSNDEICNRNSYIMIMDEEMAKFKCKLKHYKSMIKKSHERVIQ